MTLFVKPITLVKGDLVQNLISTYGTDACITYVGIRGSAKCHGGAAGGGLIHLNRLSK